MVEVGGWEHDCCGAAIERDDVVTFDCIRLMQEDGQLRLIESHHDLGGSEQVSGRVIDIHVVEGAGATRPILRLPSGSALRGVGTDEDAYLQDPWTSEVITSDSTDFLVTVQTDH